jgi:outer membrane biosynthesis protein TonB
MSSAVQLTQAVTSGDAKAVSAALAAGAGVDERNNGGQTALILAVIFGHTHLVQLLINAGANPRLRDNLGLDAVEWAKRRGLTDAIEIFGAPSQPIRQIRVEEELPPTHTQIDTDEKSRKWLAGIKQRIHEQARKETQVVESAPPAEPEPEPVPEPEPIPEPVPEREPIFEPPPSNSVTNTPLLLMFILVTVSIAAFTGYMITSQLSQVVIPDTPTATTQQQPDSYLKGTPVASGELAGKSVQLPEAECPVFENEPRPADTSYTVNVHIKIDKAGNVYWARAEGGDELLRRAASEAASNSTFTPDKLRNRETEGTITYTFTP